MSLNKYIIERDIPEVGSLEREQLAGAAAKSRRTKRAAPVFAGAAIFVMHETTTAIQNLTTGER